MFDESKGLVVVLTCSVHLNSSPKMRLICMYEMEDGGWRKENELHVDAELDSASGLYFEMIIRPGRREGRSNVLIITNENAKPRLRDLDARRGSH